MKSIEERANAYVGHPEEIDEFTSATIKRDVYIRGAKEQKAIDIDNVCNIFCYTGCPHKTDSYNCLNDKCDTWKIFRRMIEE